MLESMLLAALFSIAAEQGPNSIELASAIPTVTWSAPRQSYDEATGTLLLRGDAKRPATITVTRAGRTIQQITATRISFSLNRDELNASQLIHSPPQ
ncbi:MAG: hypothetical protein KF708_00070 [Pirellulales bacterium]|nr:hypothetical protein [Pirellulales bacterium]